LILDCHLQCAVYPRALKSFVRVPRLSPPESIILTAVSTIFAYIHSIMCSTLWLSGGTQDPTCRIDKVELDNGGNDAQTYSVSTSGKLKGSLGFGHN
jgi:hypothetical protein